MTNIKLSKRLMTIASMVDKGSIISDIGCDHALLDIYLIQHKIIKKSVAIDVAPGALKQAERNIFINNIKEIDLRLGNGLDRIEDKDKVDTIIISGMGDQTIIQILSNGIKKLSKLNTLIIQSNKGIPFVRKEITKLGYYIKKEELVMDAGIIYTVIKFCKGTGTYSKKELFFGPCLLKNKNKLFYEMYKKKVSKNKKIIKDLPFNKLLKKINLYITNLKILKEIKKDE